MTSETHNHYITSLITLDYFKFASYVSKCLKIKIYTIYNLEWGGQGNISDIKKKYIKKIIQFKFLEKYHSSQKFIVINKSVQQKKMENGFSRTFIFFILLSVVLLLFFFSVRHK